MEGRFDLGKYQNSCHEITNWICLAQRGVITRGGWHFVAEVKDSEKETRVIPFRYSELQNYIIEFGDEYLRFYMNDGQIQSGGSPYEIGSPYTEDELWDIRYAQDDRSLYLTHPDVPRIKLDRYDDDIWDIDQIYSDDGPYMDEITDASITPSGTTGPVTLTATPSLGAERITNGDLAASTGWTLGTGWSYDAGNDEADHGSDGTAVLSQDIDVDPMTEYRVVFQVKNYTAGHVYARIGGTDGTHRASDATFTEDLTATNGNTLEIVPSVDFRGSVDTISVKVILSGTEIFLDDHVESVWRIRHSTTTGRVRITEVTNGLLATGVVLETLGADTASDGYMEPAWSDANGYPKVINFHEGRIQYASTYEQPQTIWASKSGHFDDFEPGTDDNSPYAFTLSAQTIIRWMQSARVLSIGCLSGEATAIGPSDGAITVTDPPRIKDETTHGSANLQPVRINRAILFIQQAEKNIREFSYDYGNDAYSAPDITVLADHMFTEGIIDMAYQQEPYSILWALTSDGVLHGCVYDRESNSVGWFDMETDGEVESIATIPHSGQDQLWAVIRRNINGTYKRFIEYLDFDISVDCGLTYSGVPITNVSGLDHLIGETVKVVGDGADYGDFVVSALGSITLPIAASEIYAGLEFTPKIVTSRPEIQLPGGTSQGLHKSWKKIWLRLIESEGLKVNEEIIPARSGDDLMGEAPEPYTGDFPINVVGWDRDGRITIEQTLSLPAHIVALFGTLMIGDD
jgi:hypothetical protein